MDTIDEWVRAYGPYLALLGIIGAVAGFLSLKDRFKNWKALRSEKRFRERIIEILESTRQVGTYQKEPYRFFVDVLEDLVELSFRLLFFSGVHVSELSSFVSIATPFESPLTNFTCTCEAG